MSGEYHRGLEKADDDSLPPSFRRDPSGNKNRSNNNNNNKRDALQAAEQWERLPRGSDAAEAAAGAETEEDRLRLVQRAQRMPQRDVEEVRLAQI